MNQEVCLLWEISEDFPPWNASGEAGALAYVMLRQRKKLKYFSVNQEVCLIWEDFPPLFIAHGMQVERLGHLRLPICNAQAEEET